jgi:UDP-glucose 4-epimerase
MKKKIMVTGGAGYIGSHTIVDLLQAGFEVISVDNYSRSHAEVFEGIRNITGQTVTNYAIDLCNVSDSRAVFEAHPDLEGIIHFAAFKSVPESVEFPLLYYRNNLESLCSVLEGVRDFNIRYFVFSSSCSVYGNPDHLPVTEDTPLGKPECAYAASKQMGEQVIRDFVRNHAVKAMALRYFNPVGAHPSAAIGEWPIGRPNNLVPVITQTAAGWLPEMKVWGSDYDTRDGSCIRDYIHVMDIAKAHTRALQYLMEDKQQVPFDILNLGSGNGVSVLEALHSFEKVSGVNVNYSLGPRRAGDVVSIYANNEQARQQLGWVPEYDLDAMMRTAWDWQLRLGSR